ncbi:hypothetical protein [Methylobacterium oryzisoli]
MRALIEDLAFIAKLVLIAGCGIWLSAARADEAAPRPAPALVTPASAR